jgi:2-polyprenyl-3-methyl-5-hydroxy-6-metoxy-1,4-benzoquinol methylase
MDNITFEGRLNETHQERLQRERRHFNSLAQKSAGTDLKMPAENIRRYASPPENTPYALEYAFHLLGTLRDQKVLCLGCGEGLDLVILASLGAKVVAVDISDESIAKAAERARANGVAHRIEFFNCDAGLCRRSRATAWTRSCALRSFITSISSPRLASCNAY